MRYQGPKIQSLFRATLCAAAVAAVLAGCSGNSSPFPQVPAAANDSSGAPADQTGARRHPKLYVVDESAGMLTTYTEKGTPTLPTISGLSSPVGLAVDANGKIYVANSSGPGSSLGSITTYNADGSPTTPTISASVNTPWGIAVDKNGKIYVANYNGGSVTTYLADGTQTQPTISGLHAPTAVAVDENGKIYVTQNSSTGASLTTYKANGTQTKPTITQGINAPQSVVVDSRGNIYVANDEADNITTYRPNGTQRKITMGGFTTGDPGYMAIGSSGVVYVTSSHGFVTAYTRSGKPTGFEISGLEGPPLGIALH